MVVNLKECVKTAVFTLLIVVFSIYQDAGAAMVSGDTTGASNDFGNYVPLNFHDYSGPDDVWTLFLDAGESTTITLSPTTADMALALVFDTADVATTIVAFADSGFGGQLESISWTQVGSIDLFIIVDGFGVSDFGSYDLDVTNGSFVTVVPIPAAVWLFASAIGLFAFLGRRNLMRPGFARPSFA